MPQNEVCRTRKLTKRRKKYSTGKVKNSSYTFTKYTRYGRKMDKVQIIFNKVDEAISVMKEVAAWGREQGLRVWPDEWLTREELLTEDAGEENFCIGMVDGEIACAFILQWKDSAYWKEAPEYEAAYLHKFVVRRKFAHREMTKSVLEAIKQECRKRGVKYIRLDTGLDEKVVRKIYLNAGFQIVDIIDYPNGRSMALYEMALYEVELYEKALHENKAEIGKCGFACFTCPTYQKGNCSGCIKEHGTGDCFTRDCVLEKGLTACGMCGDFPCETIMTRPHATVLDKAWLEWKKESNTNR